MTRGAVLPSGPSQEDRPPTPRQMEVLRLMAQGLTQVEIADRLVLSVQSVKNHKMNAYQRLGVASGIQAMIRLGWVKVPE